MKNKKGFTLIELLAVIIILGILMIIAIPSVTRYISDSRKNAYVDTAKEIVGGARNMVNEGKLEMYDTDVTYYIESSCIKTENASKSPYGEFTKAYVVVTYDGKGYTYYWTSVDDAGQGIKNMVRIDKLDTDNVESDLKDTDISTLRGIDGRSKTVVVSKQNNCQKEGANQATIPINGETGEKELIEYPSGKDKTSVVVGDIVKIGTEEFYVVKHDGNDLILLARYNLNVGNNPKGSATGMQDSNVVGSKSGYTTYGTVSFSSSNYWNNGGVPKDIYPGAYYPGPTYPYVYDNNCNIKEYVDNYANSLGINVKSARLLLLSEAEELGCVVSSKVCYNAPSFVKETNYWLGYAKDAYSIWNITPGGSLYGTDYGNNSYAGIRPVIVI